MGLGVEIAVGIDRFFGYFLEVFFLESSLSWKFKFLTVGVGLPHFIFVLIPIFLSLVKPLMMIDHFLGMFYTFLMMILISRRNLLMIAAILGVDSVVRDGGFWGVRISISDIYFISLLPVALFMFGLTFHIYAVVF